MALRSLPIRAVRAQRLSRPVGPWRLPWHLQQGCVGHMTRLGEFEEAAVEALWMSRLAESRLLSPADPAALDRYAPVGSPGSPWKYDYYSHVLASQRLLNSAEAIAEIIGADESLKLAVETFRTHWQHLRGLRNVLQHPRNTTIRWDRDVWAFPDRIEYRLPGCDPIWVFTIEELHAPVERLWAAVHIAMEGHATSNYDGEGRRVAEAPP